MRRFIQHLTVIVWVASIFLRPFLVHAQTAGPGANSYIQPGERMVTLTKPLLYKGRFYEIHYFTSGDYQEIRPNFISIASERLFQDKKIQALLITADGVVVADEAIMREVLLLYRVAFEVYEGRAPDYLGYVDDAFIDDFRAITKNPVFIEQHVKSIFKTPEEEISEAMRGIVTSQIEPFDNVKIFADNVRKEVERIGEFEDAIGLTIEAARFSNDKKVREIGKDIGSIFKDWQKTTEQGRSFVDYGGKRIEFFNALDILGLSIRLIWLADLQRERAQWLDDYSTMGLQSGALDNQQLIALAVVKAETEDQWMQRSTIILGFVRDKAVDLGVRVTEQIIMDRWVKWSWNAFGKRITGHLVAGVASAAFLGLTLGNILYGLDDLYTNFKAGERADDLRRKFRTARLALEAQATQGIDHYDGHLAERYRVVYMLEALAAAQMYRSYSDGVEATVHQGLLSLINPIAWLKGKEWREAIAELRKIGQEVEKNAERDIGHPQFIDAAITLAMQRLEKGVAPADLLVDDEMPGFNRSGPQEYWQAAPAGYGSGGIWTYCDANKRVNAGRWTAPPLRAGVYQVQAFVPPPHTSLPKPYTQAARYTIAHAGAISDSIGNQQAASGDWLDLGVFYFEGNGAEYIELVDHTGETSGSTLVMFDAVRWIASETPAEVWNAAPPATTVYDVVMAGEMADLDMALQNTGQAPWAPADVELHAIGKAPDGAPASLSIDDVILPGATAHWRLSFPVSGAPGVRRLSYQVHHHGQPFGEVITAYVIVLPEQLQDAEQRIRDQIDEWQRQGEQKAEEFMQRLWDEIQKEIERQATSFIEGLFAECFGSTALLGLALVFVYQRSRRG